jgi:DAK2 domain fusion protein YloV
LAEQQPNQTPISSIDGQTLKQAFAAGTAWLESHAAYVNSLNVFPVPDGDSGTNMLMTMQAAMKEVNSSPDHSAAAICKALSYGALLGARGNSGVILSQIIRGFTTSIEKLDEITAKDLATALVEGSRMAYKGVVKPVEGTILTVAREAADAAMLSAARSDDLRVVLTDTVNAARASVVRTPTLLPVLKEAGVVDAGGQGFLVVLEGALKFLNGESIELAAAGHGAQALEKISREEGWGFDIQFHIRGNNLDVDTIREKISGMGESALIVGDPSIVKVHVHAPSPGAILDYGVSVGVLSNIIVENMQEQYIDFMGQQSATVNQPQVKAEDIVGISTVAVAPGNGIARVFESLGVGSVIPGGQTMNPSTEDILKAVENAKADQVIVLPNNKNIILAAQQAKALCKKTVEIVPTMTIPQGIAAMIGFNYQSDLYANVKAMTRAAANVQTAEITTATRSVSLDGVEVKEGQVIGLIDGLLVESGADRDQLTLKMLKEMRAHDKEIITVYYGESVKSNHAEDLANQIRKSFPSQEVELINGGQPHYHYILSVE